MLGEMKYVAPPINWTRPEERAQWYADHPAPDQKLMRNSKQALFLMIQKQFTKEFAEFKNFIDGKLLDEDGNAIKGKTYFSWFYKKLYYIEFPELFEKDVAGLGVWDDIRLDDRAWIKNTRDLIHEYYAICIAEQKKLWPDMAEVEK